MNVGKGFNDFVNRWVEPSSESLYKTSESMKDSLEAYDKSLKKFEEAVKKSLSKAFGVTYLRDNLKTFKKNLKDYFEAFDKKNPYTAKIARKVSSKVKGKFKSAEKFLKDNKAIKGLKEFLFGTIIDVIAFNSLLWLSKPENQEKLKSALETLGLFVDATAGFFEWVGSFFGEGEVKDTIAEIQDTDIHAASSRAESNIVKSAKLVDTFDEIQPLDDSDIEETVANLNESAKLIEKSIPGEPEAAANLIDSEMAVAKAIGGGLFSPEEVKSADEQASLNDELFSEVGTNSTGGGEFSSNASSLDASGLQDADLSNIEIPEVDKDKFEESLNLQNAETYKPLPETIPGNLIASNTGVVSDMNSGYISPDSIDWGDNKPPDEKKFNDLFRLPFTVVGTSILGLLSDSLGGFSSVSDAVFPLVNSLASSFGISGSTVSKLFNKPSGNRSKVSDLLKVFVAVLENTNVGQQVSDAADVAKKSIVRNITETITGEVDLSDANDTKLLQQIALAEAKSEGLLGMALVVNSIFNRKKILDGGASLGTFMADDRTLRGIIYGQNQYEAVSNGSINKKWSSEEYEMANEAIALAQDHGRLTELLSLNPTFSESDIVNLLNSTGFRNYSSAFTDSSQTVNEVKFKNHTFNTAGHPGIERKMRGGLIENSMKPLGDNTLALLENGEYVLNKNAVSALGTDILDYINYNSASRFSETRKSNEKNLREIARNPDRSSFQRFKVSKKGKSKGVKVVNIPAKVQNNFNSNNETIGGGTLGKTKDLSILQFSQMVERYV